MTPAPTNISLRKVLGRSLGLLIVLRRAWERV